MFRTPVRIACLVIGLLATAGIGYRVFQDETALNNQRATATEIDRAAGRTAELLLDLRASLHAYVAPGQGLPFWGKRAQEGIQSLREQLAALDDRLAPAGSLKQALDGVTQLEAAERRARTYASRDEMQLAGDVIFTEVRDALAAMTSDVESVRTGLRTQQDRRAADLRQEQVMLAGSAVALWIVIAVLLLPTQPKPVDDPAAWRNNLKDTISKPIPVAPDATQSPAPPPIAAPLAPRPPEVPVSAVRRVSEICADLASLSDAGALQGALERVNAVLNATGLIVWVASNDGGTLSPVATHGFDPKVVSRIGKVAREDANVTAAAFRDNTPKISAPTATAPGAFAVPMFGPGGPAGVLSVELKSGQTAEEGTVALAAIVAAQLATLTMPIQEIEQQVPLPERAAI